MIIKNFKNSRENIDIKQKDIAEFFNLNFTTISGWETGKDTIPLIRKRNAMTQEEVAKKINTSQANYAHYENSQNLIPTIFLYNLTLVYKPFSIDKLLGRKKQ